MQRKRYRDYSTSVDLGHTLNFVPVSQMRKFAMKRLLKLAVLVIIGFIVVSVYMKYNLANLKDETDILRDKLKEKSEKETDGKGEIEKKVKEQVQKVFEEFKRSQQEKENKNVFEADIEENAQENAQENDNDNGVIDEEVEKSKDNPDDDVDEANADFIKLDIDAGDADDKIVDNVVDDAIGKLNQKIDTNGKELEVEIEERLAEALKDAANKVEEERQELQKEDTNKEQANKIEEELEKEEFQDTVKNIDTNLKPNELEKLRRKIVVKNGRHDEDHEFPPFVTAARQSQFHEVLQLIYSIQNMMPGEMVHVYDLDLTNDQKKHLMSICIVRLQIFMKVLFPSYVSNLDNSHWKPLVIQTALAEFGHMIWINPTFKLTGSDFASLIHDSHDSGVLLISYPARYTTYAVTHPSMYKFIPTNLEKLKKEPHLEIQAMIIHNTEEVHGNFMKLLTACAMEQACLAPTTAEKHCDFDFTGRKYASCHRYAESAINILLKNMFDFDETLFSKTFASMFRPVDQNLHYTPRLKYCRDMKDIDDSEL